MPECHCNQGWVCELHPDQPHPHDDCQTTGKQCENPHCPWWAGHEPAALLAGEWQPFERLQPQGTKGRIGKRTGLVCPDCRKPVAVIENRLPNALVFWCPGCDHRWSAAEPGARTH